MFAVLLALLLLCSCAKTGRTAEQPDASAKAEQTELPPEETAPETAEADPSDDHTVEDPTEAIFAEDEIALMRELEAQTALHPAHPALDTQWLDRRAMSKWVLQPTAQWALGLAAGIGLIAVGHQLLHQLLRRRAA